MKIIERARSPITKALIKEYLIPLVSRHAGHAGHAATRMIVASNTSPITNLACVGRLDLLRRLYGQTIIPQAVFTEIAIAGADEPGAKEV